MKPVAVVGSGASGVHFAQSLLERGRDVLMLDVGHETTPSLLPGENFSGLKEKLDDPVRYLLGEAFDGVTYPGADGEYYGLPPSKSFVFGEASGFRARSTGFAPLFSFARGGLAEAWTGGVYPFSDYEVSAFPFDYDSLHRAYGVVAGRIGISGSADDDLARFMPAHEHLLEPITLDRHSARLVQRYERVRRSLNEDLSCWLGRTRVATLTRPREGREACTYLGRCLWGCPRGAFYTPAITLAECMKHPRFAYLGGLYVTRFIADRTGRVSHVVARDREGSLHEFAVDALALAAGTLCSARIFLESVFQHTGEVLRLPGLMDNRQVLVPFVNLDMIGIPYDPASYQYHLLGLGLEQPRAEEYVHGQITTMKTGMAHAVIQSLPLDLRTGTEVFRRLRSALGIINVNFHDMRRDDCFVTLEPGRTGDGTLVIEYRPRRDEQAHVDQALARIRRALRELHCIVPPGMVHTRPMGSSVHYAGTLPMTGTGGSLTTTPDARSRDYENLFFVDGSTFPFLPAKNITFSLMANAVRIAESF